MFKAMKTTNFWNLSLKGKERGFFMAWFLQLKTGCFQSFCFNQRNY